MRSLGLGFRKTLEAPDVWFERTYGSRLGTRAVTFAKALELLSARTGRGRTIVETGCVRERNDYSAGYSTVVFAQFAERYGGRVFTVDLSARNMDLCRRITKRWATHVNYEVGDSIAYLRGWSGSAPGRSIDLLYLDSWDYPVDADDDSQEASQRHCLGELEAALPFLHDRSLVLIDDGALPGGGKPLLAKRRLESLGWSCVIDAYQTLWSG